MLKPKSKLKTENILKYFIFCLVLSYFVFSLSCKEEKIDSVTVTTTSKKTTYDSVKKDGIVVFLETNQQFPRGRVLYALHEKTKIQVSPSDPFQGVMENKEFLVIIGERETDVVVVSFKQGKVISSLSQEKKGIIKKCIVQLSEAEQKLKPAH